MMGQGLGLPRGRFGTSMFALTDEMCTLTCSSISRQYEEHVPYLPEHELGHAAGQWLGGCQGLS